MMLIMLMILTFNNNDDYNNSLKYLLRRPRLRETECLNPDVLAVTLLSTVQRNFLTKECVT